MAQSAYDALSEKQRLESAGFAAAQADAIVQSMTRTMTVNQQMSQELSGVKRRLDGVESRLDGVEGRLDGVESRLTRVESNLSEVKTDLAVLKNRTGEMATSKDLEAAFAILRADMYRALWVQGLSLGTLILGLAVVVAGAAVF